MRGILQAKKKKRRWEWIRRSKRRKRRKGEDNTDKGRRWVGDTGREKALGEEE